jgi:uncharacterized protein (DUF169 family)
VENAGIVRENERKVPMNKIRRFERIIGGRWTGIKFHRGNVPDENMPNQAMRFCEAIKASTTGRLTLTKDLVACPGALRSFGWVTDKDEILAQEIAEKRGMKKEAAQALIRKIPRLDGKISGITIGDYDSPDLILSYIQPEAAMQLVYQWQKIFGTDIDVKISSIMAVCGNVAASAQTTDKICMSFGCPESRNHGGIGRDRLVIGIPAHLIEKFFY